MGPVLKDAAERFSYRDYLSWQDPAERWELIDGVAYDMSPAPLRIHQDILGELYAEIKKFLKDKPCRVYVAPFDVRLPRNADDRDEQIDTVVQPDITVVCDPSKLDERGMKGAPDLVVEVFSLSTAKKRLQRKIQHLRKARRKRILDR